MKTLKKAALLAGMMIAATGAETLYSSDSGRRNSTYQKPPLSKKQKKSRKASKNARKARKTNRR